MVPDIIREVVITPRRRVWAGLIPISTKLRAAPQSGPRIQVAVLRDGVILVLLVILPGMIYVEEVADLNARWIFVLIIVFAIYL